MGCVMPAIWAFVFCLCLTSLGNLADTVNAPLRTPVVSGCESALTKTGPSAGKARVCEGVADVGRVERLRL